MITSVETEAKTRIQHEMRSIFKDVNTFEGACTMLLDEGIELTETVVECEIGQCITPLAFEIGDIFVVKNRVYELAKKQNRERPEEVQGVIEYAIDLCQRTGLNPDDCLRAKLIRNAYKYQLYHSNEPWSYQEAKGVMVKMWELLGGDEKFSEMYMEMGDEI